MAFFEAGGARLFVVEWGEGVPLVCVHGLGGGAHFFEPIGRAMAGRVRTIAVDLPGSGVSPADAGFSFDRAAAIVADLVRQLRLDRVAFAGHSLGTIVGLEAIRRAPGLITHFIAIGGLPEASSSARERLAARAAAIRSHGLSGLGREVALANLSARTMRERPEVAALFARLFERQSVEGYLATAEALIAWRRRPPPDLSGTSCLLVTGAEDRYATPDAMQMFATDLPADTRVETMGDCAHLPFFEQPLVLADLVQSFVVPAARERRVVQSSPRRR